MSVAFDLIEMDRLARELDTAGSLLTESAMSLYGDLGRAGISTDPARRIAEIATWCHERAAEIRRRAAAARAAQLPLPSVASPSRESGGSGGGGVRGWLADRADDIGDAADGIRDGAQDLAGEAADAAGGALDAVGGWATDRWEEGARAVDDLTDRAGETFDEVIAWASRTASDSIEWVDGALDDAGAWIDDNLSGVRTWIGDHADVLRTLSDVLSWAGKGLVAFGATVAVVSAAVGAFTGIGFLGEIPAGLIVTIGFALWGAGAAVDTAVDWGEGKVDGRGLLTGVVVEVISSIAAGKVLKTAGKVLEPLLPRARRWVDDLLRRDRDAGPGAPLPDPVRPDPPGLPGGTATPNGPVPPAPSLPGMPGPLRGGTVDVPFRYEFTNPAGHLRDAPQPLRADINRLAPHRSYAPGTQEHLDTAWRDYLERKLREGRPPQDWERWRTTYVRNQGQAAQGRAYEEAFRAQHGFDPADGWRWRDESGIPSVEVPGAGRRDYDIVDTDDLIAYELKSGDSIDLGQLAKDRELVATKWEIVYVFGREPTAAVRSRLDEAGIRVEVWHGTPVMTP